ncbi:GNAT family N-acetyltransferase [Kiloniella sp.]|uniref:GNAT family N-acetyltransferase n=1 Tax=Kiloniella sp. TaxID=1938587 RepID=UPI003B029823
MSDLFENCLLKTARLLLRPYAPDDAISLQRIASDPRVLEHLPDDPLSLEQVKDIIEWSMNCHKKNTKEKLYKLNLSILSIETGELIGWCGLGPADWDTEQTEIYYAIAFEHWGKGLASEAARSLRDHAIKNIGLQSLVGIAAQANTASNRVLQKLGMKSNGQLTTPPEGCDPYFLGQNLYSLTD